VGFRNPASLVSAMINLPFVHERTNALLTASSMRHCSTNTFCRWGHIPVR
jgi:hypothetical protein